MNIIMYDEKNLQYTTGVLQRFEIKPNIVTYKDDFGMMKTIPFGTSEVFLTIKDTNKSETIKLDETMMKRIAKYNKEVEINKLNEEIKEKELKIKELDDILTDKEKRVDKLKSFIKNIYNLDLDDDDEEDYWDY